MVLPTCTIKIIIIVAAAIVIIVNKKIHNTWVWLKRGKSEGYKEHYTMSVSGELILKASSCTVIG